MSYLIIEHMWLVSEKTGLTNVHDPPKVITGKGVKQVGQVTSVFVATC